MLVNRSRKRRPLLRRPSQVRAFLLFFSAAMTALPLGSAFASANAAPPAKPLVVLFPGPVAGAAIETKKNKEELTDTDRTLEATRSLRERLEESGAVSTAIYAADSPLFLRAAREGKVTLLSPDYPSAVERLALGKAAGAAYLVLVQAKRDKEVSGASIEIIIEGTDTETQKTYRDTTRTSDTPGSLLPSSPSKNDTVSDPNAVPVTSTGSTLKDAKNILVSATNTLSLRLLGGPLGEYTRTAPPPELLPPPAKAAPDAAAPPLTGNGTEPAGGGSDNASIIRQAALLRGNNDTAAAITMLRHAINQNPLSLPLRAELSRAYLAAGRSPDAIAEIRRALSLTGSDDRDARMEMTKLLAETFRRNGDTTAARATYEQIIAAQPQAHWASLALADLLAADDKLSEAEAIYREIRTKDSQNRDAATGLARLLALKGDYEGALSELSTASSVATGDSNKARYEAALTLFDEGVRRLAALNASNREAWEGKRLSRETFYKATSAQTARAGALLAIVRAVPPPTGSPENTMKAYRRRVLAGSLLAQSVASLLSFLETGKEDEGTQAQLLLTEAQRELTQAQTESSSPQ